MLITGQIERKDLAAVETVSAYQIIENEHAQTNSHEQAQCCEHKSLCLS